MADDASVFVVDDDEAMRDSLAILLESAGYRTRCFASSRAFLEAAPRLPVGCAVIDVRMPELGGLELQEELRARAIPIPVVVMTGHADVPAAVRAMKAGAVDFVEKPFGAATIIAAVEQALTRARETQAAAREAAAVAARLEQLTPREREVLAQLVRGHPNKVIAAHLDISPRTVEIHRARVMEKMQAKSVSELVRQAIAAGLIAPQ